MIEDLDSRIMEDWKTYWEYCDSDAFYIWKEAVLKYHKYVCKCCGNRAATVHHKRYVRWGTETIADGVPVCYVCHRLIHRKDQMKHYHPKSIREILPDAIKSLEKEFEELYKWK